MIAQLESQYPVTLLCELLQVARSSYYYEAGELDERTVRQALEKLAAEFPTYGSRRLSAQLRRAPYRLIVNRKRVQRLMSELGIQVRTKRVSARTTNSRHSFARYPNLVQDLMLTRPDEVWVADITYIKLRHEFIYLAVVMDVYTRVIRGWQLSAGLGADLALGALDKALQHSTPQIHHSDQGVQYASTLYTARLLEVGAQISMAEVGESAQNGYAERVIRTIKEEEVALNEYADLADAERNLKRFIDDVYRYKRIHSSLQYQTPAEFEAAWQARATVLPVATEISLQRATPRGQEPAV
jgi:putative transposase